MYYVGSMLVGYDYLCHYGVKGMRWGVVRSPEQLGHPSGPSKHAKSGPTSHVLSKKDGTHRDSLGQVVYKKSDPFGTKINKTIDYYKKNPLSFIGDAARVYITAKVLSTVGSLAISGINSRIKNKKQAFYFDKSGNMHLNR